MKIVNIFTTLFIVSVLAACTSTTQFHYYTLSPIQHLEKGVSKNSAGSIGVMQVSIPEIADRPNLEIKQNDGSIELLESYRWGEPLKSSIPRVIAINLSKITSIENVSSYPNPLAIEADKTVSIDFQRFEAESDNITIEALWRVKEQKSDKSVVIKSSIKEPLKSTSPSAIPEAFSRALYAISKEIAEKM